MQTALWSEPNVQVMNDTTLVHPTCIKAYFVLRQPLSQQEILSVIVKNEQAPVCCGFVSMRCKDYTDFTVVTPGVVITICVDYST